MNDWLSEEPALRQLYEQALRTINREHQQALIRQMEQHTHDQAYFLFLYNPIEPYAVNKAVAFVPIWEWASPPRRNLGDGSGLVGAEAEGYRAGVRRVPI